MMIILNLFSKKDKLMKIKLYLSLPSTKERKTLSSRLMLIRSLIKYILKLKGS